MGRRIACLMEKIYGINLSIKLKPGLYRLYGFSGAGKTYAFKLLKRYSEDMTDEEKKAFGILCVTYYDYKKDPNAIIAQIPGKKLIFFDRYDLYTNFALDELKKESNSAVILLEYKLNLPIRIKTAHLHRYDDSITIKE